MPSSWSASLRFELQFTGENINLWGDRLNAVVSHADYAIAGFLTKALTTSPYALSTANAGDDEARAAMLKFTGAGAFTVTIPSVSKAYLVWNACSGILTLTTGSGATVGVDPGDILSVFCDGANVKTLSYGGVSIKDYVAAIAWSYNAGNLPAQAGNAGKFVKTDGTNAGWSAIATTDVGGFAASAPMILAASSLTAAFTPGGWKAALTPYALTDGPTVTPDGLNGLDFTWTIGGNRTLAAITNTYPGAAGSIEITQDATGNRILAVASAWKRSTLGVLSTPAGSVDELEYKVRAVDGSGVATRISYDILRRGG